MRTLLVLLGLLLCLPQAAQPQASPQQQLYRAQISEIAPDQSLLTVLRIDRKKDPAKWEAVQLTVADPGLRSLLEDFDPNDQVAVTSEGGALRKIAILRVSIPLFERLLGLLGTAGLLLLIAKLLTGRLARLIVGEDNRYSKSKFQIAFWFLTAISVYLATLWFRWLNGFPPLVGGVAIPENLLLLSGISALTFAGAKGINQNQDNAARAAGRTVKVKQPSPAGPSFPSDLVNNDAGQPDLGDFQMVLITLIAGLVYASQVVSFLAVLDLGSEVSIPDVDATLLGIFGISHGAYLAKKFAGGDSADPPRTDETAVPPANL